MGPILDPASSGFLGAPQSRSLILLFHLRTLIKPYERENVYSKSCSRMSPSQLDMKFEDIPLHSLYQLLRPITLPAASTRFNNWGLTYFCTPLAIFEPESEIQCKLILELARREGCTVRAIGMGHSPSDLACTSGYMVRLTKMNRVIQVSKKIFLAASSRHHHRRLSRPCRACLILLRLLLITLPFLNYSHFIWLRG